MAWLILLASLGALNGHGTLRWAVRKPSVLIPNVRQCQFAVTHRNKASVADVSYIRTWQVWLYLAVVMNLFSRKIVRWAAGPPSHRESC